MDNKEISQLLRKVAAAYTLKNEAKFRFQIIAYQRAADAVEHSTTELKDLWEEGRLNEIPGIGPGISGHLDKLFKTGNVPHFNKLMEGIPETTFELFEIPGMGPKKAFKLVSAFNIRKPGTAVDEVEEAAKAGRIAELEGFGEKSEADILKNISRYKKGSIKENRMNLPFADAIAREILDYLRKNPQVKEAEALGSLRRKVATIGDIDIAVASSEPENILDYFCKYPKQTRILEKGDATASILVANGRQIDLMVQPPKSFGSLLQHFTGSKQHNIHLREYALKEGLSLSEYGIKSANNAQTAKFKKIAREFNYNSQLKVYQFTKEAEFYNAIGLPWIPPELREDRGEIETAAQNQLPKLIEQQDIKGDLHVHSNYDIEPSHDLGVSSLEEIVNEANNLGYEYVGISDHNPSINKHSENDVIAILKRRNEHIEQYNNSWKERHENRVIKMFKSLEVDILSSGKLAVPEAGLELLDFYIVSIHSSFDMTKQEMTKRILGGLSHHKAKILGHPTGRLLGQREGYDADWDKIFDYCKKNNIAIEINSYPTRLDLPDSLVREAVKIGVKIIINTDSHVSSQMKLMYYGIEVARRGWCTVRDVVNTMGYNEFKEWVES